MAVAEKFENLLAIAGFCDIKSMPLKLPFGPWPKDKRLKEIGLFQREQFNGALQGIAMSLFAKFLGLAPQEIEVYLTRVRRDLYERKNHGYCSVYDTFCSMQLVVSKADTEFQVLRYRTEATREQLLLMLRSINLVLWPVDSYCDTLGHF